MATPMRPWRAMLSTQYLYFITSCTLSSYESEGCGNTHCKVWAQLLFFFWVVCTHFSRKRRPVQLYMAGVNYTCYLLCSMAA